MHARSLNCTVYCIIQAHNSPTATQASYVLGPWFKQYSSCCQDRPERLPPPPKNFFTVSKNFSGGFFRKQNVPKKFPNTSFR